MVGSSNARGKTSCQWQRHAAHLALDDDEALWACRDEVVTFNHEVSFFVETSEQRIDVKRLWAMTAVDVGWASLSFVLGADVTFCDTWSMEGPRFDLHICIAVAFNETL